MKILRQFTWASLKANRTRTLVTIIGIVLSMALFTAVLEGAYSGQQFLIRSIEESEGRWLVMESGLTAKEAAQLQGTDGVADSSVWTEVGYGKIDSKNTYKPYLRVVSVDTNVENLLAVAYLRILAAQVFVTDIIQKPKIYGKGISTMSYRLPANGSIS